MVVRAPSALAAIGGPVIEQCHSDCIQAAYLIAVLA